MALEAALLLQEEEQGQPPLLVELLVEEEEVGQPPLLVQEEEQGQPAVGCRGQGSGGPWQPALEEQVQHPWLLPPAQLHQDAVELPQERPPRAAQELLPHPGGWDKSPLLA